MRVHPKNKLYDREIKMHFYLAKVGFIHTYKHTYIHKIFEGILPYMGVAAIFVMRSRCHEKKFVPPIQGDFTYNLALIGPAVLEKKMFEHCE